MWIENPLRPLNDKERKFWWAAVAVWAVSLPIEVWWLYVPSSSSGLVIRIVLFSEIQIAAVFLASVLLAFVGPKPMHPLTREMLMHSGWLLLGLGAMILPFVFILQLTFGGILTGSEEEVAQAVEAASPIVNAWIALHMAAMTFLIWRARRVLESISK